jgi:hypothetical protein
MQMIDVAISLALVYMMMAGLVSGLQEMLASALQWRGLYLKRGIESILQGVAAGSAQGPGLADVIYEHPSIKALSDTQRKRLPSYIAASTFAVVLADELVRITGTKQKLFKGLPQAIDKLPKSDLKRQLGLLVDRAEGSPEALQAAIEAHFNEVMDRVSGWYKRRAQLAGFVLALGVAAVMNVDSIAIAGYLKRNPAEAQRLVEQMVIPRQAQGAPVASGEGAATAAPDAAAVAEQIRTVLKARNEVRELQLPLGWNVQVDDKSHTSSMNFHWTTPIGWVITALAALLGAPFWFDLISRLLPLRGSGKQTEAAPAAPQPAATPASFRAAPVAATARSAELPTAPALSDYERAQINELDITALQQALGLTPAECSGEIDADTRAALRRWQYRHGRAETGQFDEPTVMALLYGAK